MAGGTSGLARAGIAALAFAAGAAAGALAGRYAARTPPPPPPVFVNPMSDAGKGESVALKRDDGTVIGFRVVEADPQTLLLREETQPVGGPASSRQIRVSRSWFGGFLILEGDTDPEIAAAALRDLRLERLEPDTIYVEALGRPLRCWKFTATHRVHGRMTLWVSEEIPVHGLVRVDTDKAERVFVLLGSHDGR